MSYAFPLTRSLTRPLTTAVSLPEGGSGVPALPTPVLARTSALDDDTPTFTVDVPVGVLVAGDPYVFQADTSSSFNSGNLIESTGNVSVDDAADLVIDLTISDYLSDTTWYARFVATGKTSWSNVVSMAIDAPVYMISDDLFHISATGSATYVADLVANRASTFAIGGTDAALFHIVSGDELHFVSAPSTTDSYDITLTPTSISPVEVGVAQSVTVNTEALASWASIFAGAEKGWQHDMSDISTLFQLSGSSTPVTTNGQRVGTIRDLSGKGTHFEQSTSGSRLYYDVTSGRKSVKNVTSEYMVTPSNIDLSAGPIVTVVMALQDDDPTTGAYMHISDGTDALTSPSFEVLRNYAAPNPAVWGLLYGNVGTNRWIGTNTASTGSGQRFVLRVRFNFSGTGTTEVQMWVNGVSFGSSSIASNNTNSNYGSSRRLSLLARNAGGLPPAFTKCFFNFGINRDLTADEITFVEAQAAAKIA